MLCYAMLHDVTINYSTCNCGAGGEGGDFQKLVAAETSAYQISLRYFTFYLRYFNSSFRLNSCFSILYTLSPANQLGNRLFYFVSLHTRPPPPTLLPALLGSSHVNSHTLVHPKTRFGQYN